MVIWVIGLSGSGKTHISSVLNKLLKKNHKTIVIDGDEIRKFITYDLGYDLNDRKKNSKKIQDLSRYLERKGFLVIVSILSIFREHQLKNRKIFNDYFQIYIESNLEALKKKNNKGIYSKRKNVVGKDIEFLDPINSDLILRNEFNIKTEKKMIDTAKVINERIKRNNKKITRN